MGVEPGGLLRWADHQLDLFDVSFQTDLLMHIPSIEHGAHGRNVFSQVLMHLGYTQISDDHVKELADSITSCPANQSVVGRIDEHCTLELMSIVL